MPSLEELPVELRIQILIDVFDNLDAVKSLVFASPEYHQVYQTIRHDLLFMHLQKSYDGLVDIQDAIAAIRSRGIYAVYPSNREKIIALLDVRRRSDEIHYLKYSQILPDKPASVAEIIQLLNLHNIAMFLLSDYCTDAECPKWMESSKWHSDILPLQLSRLEKRRFIRAFYRLQIYGNIFGNIELTLEAQQLPEKENEWQGDNWDNTSYQFTDEEVWSLFMAPMAPWEVEELGCFWQYCFNRLEKPYMEIADSLLNSGTMFISELPTHEQPPFKRYYYDTDDLHVKEWENRDCLLSIGPSFLSKVLREPDFMTRRNLVYVNSLSNDHVFTHFWPRPRRNYGARALPLIYPADNFNFGTDFAGLEKLLNSLPDHKRPNLSWRQRWLNRDILEFPGVFEDMFQFAPCHGRWDWGYAFWDDERIIQWEVPNLAENFPGNHP